MCLNRCQFLVTSSTILLWLIIEHWYPWQNPSYNVLTAIIIRATLSSSCVSLWSKSLKTVRRMAALRLLSESSPLPKEQFIPMDSGCITNNLHMPNRKRVVRNLSAKRYWNIRSNKSTSSVGSQFPSAAPPVFPSKLCCTKVVHSASHTWQRWATSSDEVVSSSERSGATWASQNATASVFLSPISRMLPRSLYSGCQSLKGHGRIALVLGECMGFIFEESYGGSEMSACEYHNSACLIPSPPLSFSSFKQRKAVYKGTGTRL